MNIDRRSFLRSSAGALIAAAVPAIPPCVHQWNPLRVCSKCGLTMERIYFDSKPIIPTIYRIPVVLEGVFEMASGVLVTLPRDNPKVQAMIAAGCCVEKPDEEGRKALVIPASAVRWTRSRTAPLVPEEYQIPREILDQYVGSSIDQSLPVPVADDPHGQCSDSRRFPNLYLPVSESDDR